MEQQSSSSSKMETFRLFDGSPQPGFGLNFLESSEKPFPPLPPCIEVLPSQVSSNVKYTVESVDIDGITLIKGRVNTKEVFAFSNLDLVPGKYEGGLKLWEGSVDLVKTLQSEMQDGKLSLAGKRVLEGSRAVHFQDFNAEVLQSLTIPNVNANIQRKPKSSGTDVTECNTKTETRFFAGDWSEVQNILPYVRDDDCGVNADQEVGNRGGYDVILMAETVYAIYALPMLYQLIKKCLTSPHGVVYMAAKKHYFGVGGGSRRFVSIVEKDGVLASTMVAEVADGSSNLREVWKFHFK